MSKYYGYALGSAVGLNRILMMFNLIKPQISFDEEELYNRQVKDFSKFEVLSIN